MHFDFLDSFQMHDNLTWCPPCQNRQVEIQQVAKVDSEDARDNRFENA